MSADAVTDAAGAVFFCSAGTLGERIITEATDGGTEIVLDNPIMLDLTNAAHGIHSSRAKL